MNSPIDCLVLAGGTPERSHPLYAETLGRPKALLDIAGRPMVQWALDALGESQRIGRVVLVGLSGGDRLSYPRELVQVEGGGSWTDNFFAGIQHLNRTPGSLAAFCWSDIPLIRASVLDRFLDGVGESPRQVHAGLVERGCLEDRFGPLDEPWLRLRDGQFVAADFGVFQPAEAERLRGRLEELAPQRKSALQQARTVGWGLLLRYVLGRLGISDLERHLERTYEIGCRVHVVADPELGLDVDGPGNLAICRRELTARPRL